MPDVLVETGNGPDPDDGPQGHVPQTTTPGFDDDLVDGATLASER